MFTAESEFANIGQLPSPWDLQNMIVIKNKLINRTEHDEFVAHENEIVHKGPMQFYIENQGVIFEYELYKRLKI